ncbi:MAG: iron ABC transporter permease [Xanthobacteraceae bacterium]|nr:iron ABC transporter permease [Xanthobacteraceae bacterium]
MNAEKNLSRRAFAQGLLFASAGPRLLHAQGFAGLGAESRGYEQVVPGRELSFPTDHGPHPGFRIEWWYVTANLRDKDAVPYGAQWTLFRQSMSPDAGGEGWDSAQIWLGHAAVTSATTHRFAERVARGGVGQAGAVANPFHAWIDAWEMKGSDATSGRTFAPIAVSASGQDFAFNFDLTASRPLVLQGDAGYSQKSEAGQASYYYSQPFFDVRGRIQLDGRVTEVEGPAWLDREWSSQPLASNQKGWDWIALHLSSGEKVMMFRLRQDGGKSFLSGNWIDADGRPNNLRAAEISMTPLAESRVAGRSVPTQWALEMPSRGLKVKIAALNPQSWMGTSIPYWEGPVSIEGSHTGVGYLEATGYAIA